jgi:hypothetical protein
MKSLNHVNQSLNLPCQRFQPPQHLLRLNPPRIQLAHRKHHTRLQIVNRNQKRLIKNLTITPTLLRPNNITNQAKPHPKSQSNHK